MHILTYLLAVLAACANAASLAATLGVAAGAQFGLTATLMKGMTGVFSQGFSALFTGWQVYGMVASGLLGMFLLQSAMNAGRLIAAQPAITLSDPVVSVLWGVLAFGERVRGGWFAVAAAVCAAAIAAAVLVLARSPLLEADTGGTAGDRGPMKQNTGPERAERQSGPRVMEQ